MLDRARRLGRILPNYAQVAWWGLVTSRVSERGPLTVHQGVVLSDDRVLLTVREELRGWELPGGYPEPGETGEESVAREVLEETGISVRVEGHVGDYVRTGFRPHTARVYRCRATGGRLRPSLETPVVRWFDCDRLPTTIFPWFRTPLEDALAGATGVARREHQGLSAILRGMAIDVRMRWRGDRAGGEAAGDGGEPGSR